MMLDDITIRNVPDHLGGVSQPADPAIAVDEIQGDVLIGLPKKAQVFVFFSITDRAAFKTAFAKSLLDEVTTTHQAQQQMEQIAAAKKAGDTALLPIFGFNVGFTNHGIALLAGGTDGMDGSFVAGAKQRALEPELFLKIGMNDPQDAAGALSTWHPKYLADDKLHGVMMFTGPQCDAVEERADDALAALGAAVAEVRREVGTVRPGLEAGHEHFGYLDGVSQPGVRGITSRTDPATRPNQGLPGQELLWPGQFVFGYPGQTPPATPPAPPIPDEYAPGPAPTLPANLDWMKNGSFLVFRRLNQKVPELHEFAAQQGTAQQTDPTLLEARMVGRWKSGAPLEISPLQDDPELAKDETANNDFVFSSDVFQRACPYAAHIRKVNPRDDEATPGNGATDADTHAAVLVRRVIRAGIAFGPEVTQHEAVTRTTTEERGLLFACYQTSIAQQFEFLQTAWANNPGFIFNKNRPNGGEHVNPGLDPLIGQAAAKGDRKRTSDEPVPNFPGGSERSTLSMPDDFVVPTGGAYLFVPSISALKTTLLT